MSRKPVEAAVPSGKVVAIISSADELRIAARLRELPDFFELRLDLLPNANEQLVRKLCRPLIITARHPAEGGRKLAVQRRDILLQWLPFARFVDVELRSVSELRDVLDQAAKKKIGCIISAHHLKRTPPLSFLNQQFRRAEKIGAEIFKVVARADSPADLVTLLRFLQSTRACVMPIGKFGKFSRLLFPQCGSPLVYAPLRRRLHAGQLTLRELQQFRQAK